MSPSIPFRRAPRSPEKYHAWVWQESEKCPVFRATGLGGGERPLVIHGQEARRFIYNRQMASRKGHGILYQTPVDRRMIPEIYRAIDTHVSVDTHAADAVPVIRAHLARWAESQQLDFQPACRELAFAIGWQSQLGEPVPAGHSVALSWDFLSCPGVREHSAGYKRLIECIRASVERAAARRAGGGTSDAAFVHFYLAEEAAGRMTREGTVDALIGGMNTVGLMKCFCALLVELQRMEDTGAPGAWRRDWQGDRLQQLVTEAFHMTPLAPTVPVSMDATGKGGCPHHVHGVPLKHGEVVQYSAYGENYEPNFDPRRWQADPADLGQVSVSFAGAPGSDTRRDPETGLPPTIHCPAKKLMHAFARAFGREILHGLHWRIQRLPKGPAPPLWLVTYPLGLRGSASLPSITIPRPEPPTVDTGRRIPPGAKVVVIGGGIGGLVAARELQKRGCTVVVLEAGPEVGAGKCETLQIEGRGYNVGAHLVKRDGPVAALAAEVGIAMAPFQKRHRKFGGGSGQCVHDQGLEGMQEVSRGAELLARADAEPYGFVGLSGYAASVRRLRDDDEVRPFVDHVHPIFHGAGYGRVEDVSAAYLLRFAEASEHSLLDSSGTPEGGFGPLLKRLAVDLDVRCEARVVHLDRSADGVVAQLANGARVEADHALIACNRPTTFLAGDAKEAALLAQIRYLPYMTGIIRAEGLDKSGFCVHERPAECSHISAYVYYHPDTNVLVWWGYAKSGQSDADYMQAALDEIEAMGASFPEGRTPLYFQRWDYMPHVAPGDFAAGFYDKLAARQGHNRTWFGGGLMGFELTDCITGWTRSFIDRVCRADDKRATPADDSSTGGVALAPLPTSMADSAGIARWFASIETAFPTIIHGLRHHAQHQGDREMIVSLEKGRQADTFAEMWAKAERVAAQLDAAGLRRGDRAVLVYPPDSTHFPAAFYACLMLGVVAIPVAPPVPLRGDEEGLQRFGRIVANAGAVAALTDAHYHTLACVDRPIQLVRRALRLEGGDSSGWPAGLRWLKTDMAPAATLRPHPLPKPEDVAYIQYSSGSTRAPQGVVVTHAMVMHNAVNSARDCKYLPPQRALLWLPWWHDLMLVAGFCEPCVLGTTLVYFSAMKWLSRPAFWLEGCVSERISYTAAPNFALDLMVKRADLRGLAGADLSDLSIIVGGEPCRHNTFSRFVERFRSLGIRYWNLHNVMGMAESTLYISGGRDGDTRYTSFDQLSLREGGRAVEVNPEHPRAQTVIASGPTFSVQSGMSAIIADKDTGEVVPEGVVGELWITGPSVASRYIQSGPEDNAKFGVHTATPTSRTHFARTGDLAFSHEGMLYVSGRAKELIIVGGRNIIPMDLEDAVSCAHPVIRTGCVAAVGVPDGGTEAICVIVELRERAYKGRKEHAELDEVVAAVSHAVGHAADAHCRFVCLVEQSSLPKTTSGKLRRLEARRRFIDDELALVAPVAEFEVRHAAPAKDHDIVKQAEHPKGPIAPEQAARWVVEALAEVTGLEPEEFATEACFADFGIDSVGAVRVMSLISKRTGQPLAPSDFFNFPTIGAMANVVSSRTLHQAVASQSYVVLNDRRDSAGLPLDGASTLFCLPPSGGHVFAYVHLAQHLPDWTLVAFENCSAREKTPMATVVAHMVETIRSLQPEGPWNLLGYSLGGVFGGLVASKLGDCSLVLLDGLAPNLWEQRRQVTPAGAFGATATASRRLAVGAGQLVVEDDDAAAAIEAQMAWDLQSAASTTACSLAPLVREGNNCSGTYVVQLRAPAPEAGTQGTLLEQLYDDPDLGWHGMTDSLVVRNMDGGHFSVVGPQHAANSAAEIRRAFAQSPYAVANDRADDACVRTPPAPGAEACPAGNHQAAVAITAR